MNKTGIYWGVQIGGWTAYVLIAGFLHRLSNHSLNLGIITTLIITLLTGLICSHLYRTLIIKRNWLRYNIRQLLLRVIISSLFFGILFHGIQTVFNWLILTEPGIVNDWIFQMQQMLTWIMLFIIWSLLYFGFHFFENYRKEEIKNLQWEAAKNEFELNLLKSQLNPHFIFNSMNTIRALVDENPAASKQAISQLSNILRSSLMLGKKKLIPFEEEMMLVKDFLELEHSRYEERLMVKYDIHPESGNFYVPPMMIQTLVENGIKHGISKLTKGGEIGISTRINNDQLEITIRNSGQIDPTIVSGKSGFGISSTKHRLQLLFGDKSSFQLFNSDEKTVNTVVSIPKVKSETN